MNQQVQLQYLNPNTCQLPRLDLIITDSSVLVNVKRQDSVLTSQLPRLDLISTNRLKFSIKGKTSELEPDEPAFSAGSARIMVFW